MKSKFKIGLSKANLMAIISLSIAGSVIYEMPYIKYTYYDAMNTAFNMTDSQSGFLLSMYAIGCMIFYIPGGLIADRFSTKKLMQISLFSTAILGYALAFTMNYSAAVVIFFLFAISTSFLFWTALMKALRIIGGKDDSGTAYGTYYALSAVVALICSFIFLAIFNAFVADSRQAMFGVICAMGTASLVGGILVSFTYKDNKKADATSQDEDKFRLKDLPKALGNPNVWLASVLMFLMYATYSTSSYFTPYMTAHIGMTESAAATLAIIRTYVLFFLSPIGGYIADKLLKSTLKFYAIGFVFLGISYIGVLFIQPGGMAPAIALNLISAAFAMMMYGVMWSILNEMKIPVTYAATAVGIASIFVYMPDLFMHTLFGNWIEVYGTEGGYFRIFLCLGILCFIAVVMSLLLAARARKIPDVTPAAPPVETGAKEEVGMEDVVHAMESASDAKSQE